MNIPIRIKQYRILSSETKFSIREGLKTLWHNLKMLFTQRIVAGGNGWIKEDNCKVAINDFSIMWKDGKPKFTKTPKGDKDIALEISQDIK